ncbi:MAG: carbohydrate kinase [Lentisphaerae bacterium]|nr:carbohydrate kinase [Lentisphaerota bacterium]
MTDGRHTLIGLGEILWDLFPEGKQLGGAPMNFAYHAHALGAESVVVSRVGRDLPGDEILERLEALSLDVTLIQRDEEHATGTVTVDLDNAGKPTFTIHENVAWDFLAADAAAAAGVREADGLCFGSLAQRNPAARKTILSMVSSLPAGGLRVFDINLRQHYFSRDVVVDSLEAANVLKINDEELPVVAAMLDLEGDERDVMKRVADAYELRAVALTRGEGGSLILREDRFAEHPGFRVEVRDTVGAGDAFTAALTMGLLAGHEADRIGEEANRVASHACSLPGGTPPMPREFAEWF